MADDDYRQIVHRGKLNRNEVAKGVGCAKSALLQNPKLRGLLEPFCLQFLIKSGLFAAFVHN